MNKKLKNKDILIAWRNGDLKNNRQKLLILCYHDPRSHTTWYVAKALNTTSYLRKGEYLRYVSGINPYHGLVFRLNACFDHIVKFKKKSIYQVKI